MAYLKQTLINIAIEAGAGSAAVVNVRDVVFRPEFRAACEQNTCGKYGRCYMCPPDAGEINTLIAYAKTYREALVFQSIGRLDDSFDIEGMQDSAKRHNALTLSLREKLAPLLASPLVLGAGSCRLCESCAKITDEPCRFPGKSIASLEAYGIDASHLAALAGMKYINGQNTVTYFGSFFLR